MRNTSIFSKKFKYVLTRTFIVLAVFSFINYTALKVYAVYYPADHITNPTCPPSDATCYVSLLPDQTGNAGKLFYTNGTNPAWASSLYWDSVNSRLGVGTANPASALSVNGDSIISGTLTAGILNVTNSALTRSNLGLSYSNDSDFTGAISITSWGDSLTAGGYPAQLATLAGATVYNAGVGGQSSTQIAVRQGGVPTTVSVSGGQIPASGGVTVTFPAGYEPVTIQGPAGGTYGTISGVYGLVTLSTGVYTFTRSTSGSIVAVSGSVPFTVDTMGRNSGSVVIWAGRNNYTNPTQVKSDIAAMVASLGHTRYLILGILNADTASEYVGGANYNTIIQLNNDLASTYGSHYIDIRSYIVSQYDPNLAQDVIDHNHDITPSSLRSDSTHLTAYGYGKVAQKIVDNMSILLQSSSQSVVTPSSLRSLFASPYPIGVTTQNAGYFTQIGIGTTSPTNNLSFGNLSNRKIWIENSATDVVGRDLTIASGGTIAGTSVNDVSGGNLILQSGLGTGMGASTISFQTGTTSFVPQSTIQSMSTKMTILGSGNVGIGTVTPSKLLNVSFSNSNNNGILVSGTGVGSSPQIVIDRGYNYRSATMQYSLGGTTEWFTGVMYNNSSSNGAFSIGTSDLFSASLFSIDTSGKIGIGTSNPSSRLTSNGAINILNENNLPTVINASSGLVLSGYNATNAVIGRIYLGDGSGYQLDFSKRTGGSTTDIFTFKDSGKMGIGTNSPTNTISLGNASSQKIWIENSATDVVGRDLTIASGGTIAGTSTSDVSGGSLVLQSGTGTGTGSSTISFQTGTTLGTGTTLQTMSTKWSITGSGNLLTGLDNAYDIGTNGATRPRTGYFGTSIISPLFVGGTGVTSPLTFRATTNASGTTGADIIFQVGANGGTESMRILNNGNIGIGTNNPASILHLYRNLGSFAVGIADTNNRSVFKAQASNAGTEQFTISRGSSGMLLQSVGTDGATAYSLSLNPFGGLVGVGTASPLLSLQVTGSQSANGIGYFVNTDTGTTAEGLRIGLGAASAGATNLYTSFYQGSTSSAYGTKIGSIAGTGSNGVAYNTTSDARLKQNIVDTKDGLDKLMNIHVKDFNFVGSDKTMQGFIAQDLYQSYPYAVSTNGDDGLAPLGPESTPWMVDYGRLTPLLVKSIQDMNLKVNDIATLDLAKENSVGSLVKKFLADAGNQIGDLYAHVIHSYDVQTENVHTKNLCIDDVCINKEQLIKIINSSNAEQNIIQAPVVPAVTPPDQAVTPPPVEIPAVAPSISDPTPPVVQPAEEPAVPPVSDSVSN